MVQYPGFCLMLSIGWLGPRYIHVSAVLLLMLSPKGCSHQCFWSDNIRQCCCFWDKTAILLLTGHKQQYCCSKSIIATPPIPPGPIPPHSDGFIAFTYCIFSSKTFSNIWQGIFWENENNKFMARRYILSSSPSRSTIAFMGPESLVKFTF